MCILKMERLYPFTNKGEGDSREDGAISPDNMTQMNEYKSY